MSNICKRPVYQKEGKAPKKRQPMRKVSRKRAEHWKSDAGDMEKQHMGAVASMACIACGKPGPSEVHHCRHQPAHSERGIYRILPGAGQRSSSFDTIPLCPPCHHKRHNSPLDWSREHGPDYRFLGQVRETVRMILEIDF